MSFMEIFKFGMFLVMVKEFYNLVHAGYSTQNNLPRACVI